MNKSALDQFWQLLGNVLAFNADAFEQINRLPDGSIVALIIVLAAGLSLGVAQSIILFINRVQPLRYLFTLLIGAVLFAFGYIFLVFSTWLITFLPFNVNVSLGEVARTLGFSYAPELFSFLGAMPYLGVPLLSLLSIWHLLLMAIGFADLTQLKVWQAVGYVALGWLLLQVLQQTVGQPLAKLGRWVANQAAGVTLVKSRRKLEEMVETGLQNAPSVITETLEGTVLETGNTDREIRQTTESEIAKGMETQTPSASPIIASSSPSSTSTDSLLKRISQDRLSLNRKLQQGLSLIGLGLFTFLIVVTLEPIRDWLFLWHENLPKFIQLIFDLVWIGIIGIVVAGLLAPLETLGWWAGWYNDPVDTSINAGTLAEPLSEQRAISRYIIYLDGIGQSNYQYLPDVEEFLDTLTPVLPSDIALIRGIIPYSVLNHPLDENRPLAFFWRIADQLRLRNPASLFGMFVNIRNVLIVAVSADQRYGPLYNQGIAQVMYNGLIKNGYRPESGIPITLIGYSGGGQMAAAAAPFLKRALHVPIEIISLGGVISGNCNVLKLEHLYQFVGDKDQIERIGPIMFPGRWPIFPLSYWNRAKRRGQISIISLGPVGHNVPGGMMDPHLTLPDGRTALQQTLDLILAILKDEWVVADQRPVRKQSNYELYQQASFIHPDYYPIAQSVSPELYQPIATWMGRLILPQHEARQQVKGALFEVYHAEQGYEHLVGRVVNLRWSSETQVQAYVRAVTQDVHFSAEAEYSSTQGIVHPTRLNHWRQVDPLESLAGSRPRNDIIVALSEPVAVSEVGGSIPANVYIRHDPIQITGRFYGLVQFLHPEADTSNVPELFRVVHFNPISRQFDGESELVRMPQVIADQNGIFPSTSQDIEKTYLNETGWYIYGAKNGAGVFVVQAIAPRALLRLQPDTVIFGEKAAWRYIKKQAWADIAAQKGRISSVLLSPQGQDIQAATQEWQEGDCALVLHNYGGIGGKKAEPAAKGPVYFGHFAYGLAQVIRDPLADELRFDIRYYQVYTQNADGLTAGTLHWSRYLGDRQFGWLGTRPISDILIKLDAFTADYDFYGVQASALQGMIRYLEVMTARYRIGDGTGGTFVAAANNCSQDSNQALFASLLHIEKSSQSNQEMLRAWARENPRQAARFKQLIELNKALKQELQPWGSPRNDWESNEYNLGSTLEDEPLRNLLIGLGSWRTLLPRLASDTIVKIFLHQGASVWVLRTNQIGGVDPDIEPVAPMTL